jgi:hypothetical protein
MMDEVQKHDSFKCIPSSEPFRTELYYCVTCMTKNSDLPEKIHLLNVISIWQYVSL